MIQRTAKPWLPCQDFSEAIPAKIIKENIKLINFRTKGNQKDKQHSKFIKCHGKTLESGL